MKLSRLPSLRTNVIFCDSITVHAMNCQNMTPISVSSACPKKNMKFARHAPGAVASPPWRGPPVVDVKKQKEYLPLDICIYTACIYNLSGLYWLMPFSIMYTCIIHLVILESLKLTGNSSKKSPVNKAIETTENEGDF